MSANSDDIRVRIAGDLSDIRRSLQQLRNDTRNAGQQARNSNRDWQQLGRGLDGLRRQIVGLATAYLSFQGVNALIRTAIANTIEQERVTAQLEARLRSTGNVAGFTSQQLLQMASDFQQVTAFGDEAITNMQTILLTFDQVRGDVFEEATEAILDLSTALGQDLAQTARQVGRVLQDPIRGVAQLREIGIQLTASQEALVRQFVETNDVAGAQRVILEGLESRFGGAARAARDTLGGALQSLKNAFGDLLEGEGGNLADVTDNLERLTATLQDPATREAFQSLLSALIALAQGGVQFLSEFATLGQQLGEMAAQIAGVTTEADRLEAEIRNVDRALNNGFLGTPIALLGKSREELLAMREELEASLEAARRAERERFGLGAPSTPDQPSVTPAAATAITDSRAAMRQLQSQLAAAGVLLKDELARLKAELDREFEDSLISFEDYYRRRAELETRAVDLQLEQQRAALALLDEEISLARSRGEAVEDEETKRAKLIAEITVLERQRADVAVKARQEQADAEEQLQRQLDGVRERLLGAQGDEVGARALALEREFEDLLERLAAEGDAEGEALVQRLINVELARARLQELETEYSTSMERLAREERRLQLQVETGVLTEREGRQRIVELHQQTATEVEALIPLMTELAAATGDPAAIERLEQLKLEIEELRSVAEQASNEMRTQLERAGKDAFADFISGAKNASEAWDGFVDNIRRRAAELVSDRLLEGLFAAFGGIGGGGGFGANFLSGFGASVLHDGGIAGRDGARRSVPALAFAAAPRFHDGGFPGLGRNEVAAVLERGEEVIGRRDPRNRLNGGGVSVNVYANDVRSFERAAPSQIGAAMATALTRARNRNG